MIWGGAFLLLFVILLVLSLVQYLILKKSFKKNIPDFPLPGSFNSGELISLNLNVFIPLLLPGFRCLWNTDLIWEEGKRSIKGVSGLQRGSRMYEVRFSETRRGDYRGHSGIIYLEDLFGFLRFTLYRGEPVSLLIYPGLETNGYGRERIVTGGETATAEEKRVRTDEFLEVRKYYPGDDARRINWKMFAASGQLFLRIGEEVPPPSGEVMLALNSNSSIVYSSRSSSDYTDSLISSFITFIYSFVEKGCLVKVFVPSVAEVLSFDPAKPDELLRALSSVTAGDYLHSIPECDFLYIISHPLSESLRDISGNRQGEMKIFIKKLPEVNWKKLFENFFFRNRDKQRISYAELKVLKSAEGSADDDLVYLKKIGKGKIHVEIL